MSTVRQWVLRIADSDLTWIGFNWMRPAKSHRVGWAYLLFSSVLLGLPGFVVGVSALYLFFGHVNAVTLAIVFAFVMAVELPLHMLFAHYWNERASRLVLAPPRSNC
jgi:hypothetical protein